MTDTPESQRLDLRSHDIAADKREEFLRLFPEARTEGGMIDFDQLRRALGDVVDAGHERYGMVWPGKADCFKAIQQPSLGTLLPDRDESVDFDTTENLIIEGDNLEVLKLLQKSYLGKVKMIYIDPPYNTGSDFIYPDDYSETLRTYLEYTGQIDSEGRKFSSNTETEGRFHSKWLNMMYPRLYLARNLLRDDGLIFVSIDDNEQSRLISLCNEIFGEDNFVGMVTRSTGTPTGGGGDILVNIVDYIVIFSKSDDAGLTSLPFTEEDAEIYDQEDEDGRYLTRSLRRTGGEDRRQDRPSMHYPIKGPDGVNVYPVGPGGYESRWICGPAKYEQLEHDGLIEWKHVERDGQLVWHPYQKFYVEGRKKQAQSLWTDIEGNKKASRDMKALFGEKVFDSPKPVELIQRCITIGGEEDGIVLDFFTGSGTTAQAVLELNKSDGGNRRFILVQLPEPTGRDDYSTIADICEERVRRVIKKLNDEDESRLPLDGEQNEDRGFRVFKLAESNFLAWSAGVPEGDVTALENQLEMHVDHTREGRTAEDQLYEILLKSGFPLTTPVERLEIESKTVFSIAEGEMLICLDADLTLEAIRTMAASNPSRVVCLDEGFAGNDQLKANSALLMKDRDIVFKTV